jgi:hypothetical protein
MAPQTPWTSVIGSESSQMSDAVFNLPTADAQLQCKYQFVHPDRANAATATMTQDAHYNML